MHVADRCLHLSDLVHTAAHVRWERAQKERKNATGRRIEAPLVPAAVERASELSVCCACRC
jgi:hypothetical protein